MHTAVIIGARVWNGAGGFEERSLWIRAGRVAELTPGREPVAARPGLEVCSWPGGYIVPGFVDAHTHLFAIAAKELRCDLARARGAADIVRLLSACAGEADEPTVGVDFDESDWASAQLPTRADLDSVSRTRAVYARRVCGHVGVANSVLLARLTSPERFVDRHSGRIVEDAVYEANRIVRPHPDRHADAVDGAIGRLHALGITSIHDIVDADSIPVYGDGLRRSRRPLAVTALLHTAAQDYAAASARLAEASGGRARAVGIKIFSDGSLGGRTAALHEPYADADTRGELLVTRDSLVADLRACIAQDIVCAVHAIGDRALAKVLDAAGDPGTRGARLRIEHAEIIGEGELSSLERIRPLLVMQPNFVRNWGGEGGMYETRLGRVRWARHNPFATLVRAGVPFVFSSDAMPPGPLYGLRGATRHAITNECIGAADALGRYFAGGSHLTPGEPADLAILSGNPVLADLDSVRVLATWIGGVEVHRAQSNPGRRSHAR